MRHTEAEARVEVRSLNNKYKQNGFPDRHSYLVSLAVYFGLPTNDVIAMSTELGADKDFSVLLDKCKARKEMVDLAFAFEQLGA